MLIIDFIIIVFKFIKKKLFGYFSIFLLLSLVSIWWAKMSRPSRRKIRFAYNPNLGLIQLIKSFMTYTDLDINMVKSDSIQYNLELLRNGDVDFALVREDMDLSGLEFVCALHFEYLILLSEQHGFNNPSDARLDQLFLQDKSIAFYDETIKSFMDAAEVNVESGRNPDPTNVILLFSEHPSIRIRELSKTTKLQINPVVLPPAFRKENRYYQYVRIPIDIYPNIWKPNNVYRFPDVQTYKVRVLLVTRPNVHKRTVYSVVENIFHNRLFLERLEFFHKLNVLDMSAPMNKNMRIHDGAKIYYKKFFKDKVVDLTDHYY